jgi:hypothetical protein
MQMLLYTHPSYDARTARGLTPVNSFWLSGTGALPTAYQDSTNKERPGVIATLREPALAEDWPAWINAWQTLDGAEVKALLDAQSRGEPVTLTLCGERHAQTWVAKPQPLLQRIKHLFGTQPASTLLEKL